MKKTSVYLTEREVQRLKRLASEEGKSDSEIVRAAIGAYQPAIRRPRRFALDGCVDRPGVSASEVSEEEYLKGFGE